jgi:hypothetical protein
MENSSSKSKAYGNNCSFVSPDYCMVQFVKPNLLGTRREFLNRFVNPISNGQFEDSTPNDVKIMKHRAHVLHKMLEGSVQVDLFISYMYNIYLFYLYFKILYHIHYGN